MTMMLGCCGADDAEGGRGRAWLITRRRALAALACSGGMLPRGARADDPYPPLLQDLVVAEAPGAGGIHYVLGHPGVPAEANEGHTSNAGFVVTDEGVVVFDTLGTPSLGWRLLQKIRQTTPQTPRFVVLSHYHADHIYGLQAFRDHSDAVIVAQTKALDYDTPGNTEDEEAAPRLAQRRQALAPWVNASTRIVEPSVTFSQQSDLLLGGRRFLLLYAGPAHSMSDSMMFIEPDGVLFAGDIVQNSRIPFMASAAVNTGNWLRGLEEVARLKPRFIIPGHGSPSSDAASAIAFTRDYIRYVRTAMQRAVDSWTDFDTAYAQTDWTPYQRLPAFNATNRGNAYRVFLEIEGGSFGGGKPSQ
ncbi:MAG: MBL fold metallo-hydrolase [Rhodospirillales bacterium]|nr:MBL fold metallo-hydrolase [Rhodospirillales bacterium]MDE2575008.1 MBL fold metallo-hydrolase [Rhodospirillales bacterium]